MRRSYDDDERKIDVTDEELAAEEQELVELERVLAQIARGALHPE